MGLGKSAAHLFAGPLARLIDGAIHDTFHSTLEAFDVARRVDVAAVQQELDDLSRELSSRRAEIMGLRQAMDALHLDLEEDLAELFGEQTPRSQLSALTTHTSQVEQRLKNLATALADAERRLHNLTT